MTDNEYLNDMRSWDWDGFKSDQVQAAIDTISDNSVEDLSLFEMVDDDGAVKGAVFLGTCFALTPSGKYYQPFACSNVETCETCEGSGTIQGKPFSGCFDCEYKGDFEKCSTCARWTPQEETCPDCNGLGSAEAYQDTLWQEALEETSEQHDMWSELGEGDPCDIFLCRWVSREEIVRYLLDGYRDVVNAWLDRKGGSIKDIKAIDPETKSILNKLDKLVE